MHLQDNATLYSVLFMIIGRSSVLFVKRIVNFEEKTKIKRSINY